MNAPRIPYIWITALTLSLHLAACSSGDKKPEKKLVDQAKTEAAEKGESGTVEDMKLKVAPDAGANTQWSYQGATGPSNWGALSEAYAVCSKGEQQSPINLMWKRPAGTRNLRFSFQEEELKIANTGLFLALLMNPGQSSIIEGNQFQLQAIEIRTPSEHKFSGQAFPAELAFIHRDQKGAMAIVSVMLSPGKANAALNRILPHIPKEKGKVTKVAGQNFHPLALLPVNYNHYRYLGSESMPPCTEGVTRIVLNTPVEASDDQLSQLRSFYYDNNRPLQKGKHAVELFYGQ